MVSNNMNNISFCAVIRYLGIKGLTPEEIHDYTVLTLRGDATSYNMVKKWDAEFNVVGLVRKTSPVEEGQSPSPYRRPLPRLITSSWQTGE